MTHDKALEIALWRVSVLGALVSARLEHGDRRQYFEAAAEKAYVRPDGRTVRLSARTIEKWYYTYLHHGLAGLKPRTRSDRGRSRRVPPELVELVIRAKKEKPRRSIRRIIRMLERAKKVERGQLSRSTVHRLLRHAGVSKRPPRRGARERRSFLVEHAGDLWLGDAMHGPHVVHDGRLRKSYMLTQLDGATRYVVHSAFYLSEAAIDHEDGFKQALLKHGLVRAYYVDRGAAYVAGSLRLICAELNIHLLHTAPQDCEAKGAIERWHRTWREEVGDELPEGPLSLEELNARHWAWLACEYHARRHETTERVPREHFLAEVEHLRPLPRGKDLDEVFWHRARRWVRKDGTVRFAGGRLEVTADLCGQWVELRYDPTDPNARPKVFVDDAFVCDTTPLDLRRNATRRRRRRRPDPEPEVEPTQIDPLQQVLDEHYQRVRPLGQEEH